jgi:regulatory protein
VAYAPLAGDAPHARDDIVRSQAYRLVDNQRSIHGPIVLCFSACSVVKSRSIITENAEENILRQRRKPNPETEDQAPIDPAKARERVFQRAARLLTAKQRSVEELRERLLDGRGATEAVVDEVIARLRDYGYLDDSKFAQSYASLRLRERPLGRRRLARDLSLKKVDKQTASTALDEVFEATPEAELIERAIAKRLRLRGKPKSREDAKKLFDHLLRQGFAFDLVSERVRRLLKDDPDEA